MNGRKSMHLVADTVEKVVMAARELKQAGSYYSVEEIVICALEDGHYVDGDFMLTYLEV